MAGTQPLGRIEARVEDGPPPGVRRLAFHCDESGISGGSKHYGFGALIMQYQRRGQFVQEFRELADPAFGEVKWNKTSDRTLDYYKRLVDYFFRTSWLYFHCIVVERAWVKVREFHGGSYDVARRKHFTRFLASKIKWIVSIDRKRKYDFRVYVDPIASSYDKADEAVREIGNRMVNKELVTAAKEAKIENVFTVDSKERQEIQLCDLLLGALLDSWNEGSSREAKGELKQHIAGYLGWDDLRHGTYAGERKFNVWWLTDQFKSDADRPVRAKPVKLVHPLPVQRIYRHGVRQTRRTR
jgi:hypothetical protein